MLTSIATVSMSDTLDKKLEAVAAAGFDGVEIFENDLLAFPDTPRNIGRIIRDLGLTCTLFQPFRDFEGLPADLRAKAFDRAERKFEVMHEVGANLLLVCSSVAPAALPDINRIVDDFRELGERAARQQVRIGYEALAWGRHVNDHRQAWDIVRCTDHPAVGIILDSFHSLVRRIPVETLRDIDPAKIFIVQLADAPWLEMDYLSWSRHFRTLPGQGDIPVRRYVSELLDIGYRGPLSLEIFNDLFRSMPTQVVAEDGLRALRLTLDESARALAIQVPPTLPPRVTCRGVEFIEFALTHEEAEQFVPMLRALGFRRTGVHRSKAMTRWQQGGISLIINSEPDGFAHAHNVVHGPAVAALGLRVDDVDEARERARMLSIKAFEGSVGHGDLPIPAIRDPAGGLIYLVSASEDERSWQQEFVTPDEAEPDGPATADLATVDHIAFAMSDPESLTWLLYYFSLFDVRKLPVVEVPDPLGLVRVQPVSSADGAFRLLLNSSAAPQTLSSRLQTRYWGVGVQYISFATNDIFASARSLRERGFEQLSIPANYYDDLATRFDLSPDQLAQMAEYGILYFRDAEQEYFQLTSRAFRKRFFFEIVQRRGYDGYGEPNELFRLAAQSRFRNDHPHAG